MTANSYTSHTHYRHTHNSVASINVYLILYVQVVFACTYIHVHTFTTHTSCSVHYIHMYIAYICILHTSKCFCTETFGRMHMYICRCVQYTYVYNVHYNLCVL
eukprot:GHVQ01017848.1.p2 GENE.GHVQ01017848.1~~GHVQ01017848.1.p2  ORF type:complete len:103 (-),score=2.91 GHVQ01017848.1:225-533(-)